MKKRKIKKQCTKKELLTKRKKKGKKRKEGKQNKKKRWRFRCSFNNTWHNIYEDIMSFVHLHYLFSSRNTHDMGTCDYGCICTLQTMVEWWRCTRWKAVTISTYSWTESFTNLRRVQMMCLTKGCYISPRQGYHNYGGNERQMRVCTPTRFWHPIGVICHFPPIRWLESGLGIETTQRRSSGIPACGSKSSRGYIPSDRAKTKRVNPHLAQTHEGIPSSGVCPFIYFVFIFSFLGSSHRAWLVDLSQARK